MRPIIGLVIVACILVALSLMEFFDLFQKGVTLISVAIDATGLALDELGVFIVFGGYVLAFWLLLFGLFGYGTKLFLNWLKSRQISN